METKSLRCEICGGELRYADDGLSAVCLACGNKYWFKEEKSEALIFALNRAAEKRRRNDFDSAIDEYKLVLDKEPDDAEAHWGYVLSTYGIEYVDDYRTGKPVPTCRRAVPKCSILDDEHYKAAIACAAPEQGESYQAQAKEIDRIQKEIIRKIDAEDDYDVFISFKSTNDNGFPTEDRYIARRIYDALESKNIKTFYSEETLRSRAFEDYEPIIYKALFSCKYFILVVTDISYLQSPWIKNEWSRFRDRVRDENLTSNCCAVFGGIKPSELPAFIRKQGIDLSKYPTGGGYEIDLADNIAVRLGKTKRRSEAEEIKRQIEEQRRAIEESQRDLERKLTAAAKSGAGGGASATVRTLLTRAGQEREDGNIAKAMEYYGKVLDADPENSDGWFGQFLCESNAKNENSLNWITSGDVYSFDKIIKSNRNITASLSGRNLRNAIGYADPDRKSYLEQYRQKMLDKANEIEDSFIAQYIVYGNTLLQRGEWRDAKDIFSRALTFRKDLADAYMGIVKANCKTDNLNDIFKPLSGNDLSSVEQSLNANKNLLAVINGDDYGKALRNASVQKRLEWEALREDISAKYEEVTLENLQDFKKILLKVSDKDKMIGYDLYRKHHNSEDIELLWQLYFASIGVKDMNDAIESVTNISDMKVRYKKRIYNNEILKKIYEVSDGKDREEFFARVEQMNKAFSAQISESKKELFGDETAEAADLRYKKRRIQVLNLEKRGRRGNSIDIPVWLLLGFTAIGMLVCMVAALILGFIATIFQTNEYAEVEDLVASNWEAIMRVVSIIALVINVGAWIIQLIGVGLRKCGSKAEKIKKKLEIQDVLISINGMIKTTEKACASKSMW